MLENAWLEASQRLLSKEVVGFPTETIYGLGADPSSFKAVSSLLDLKNRPKDKGLPLVTSSVNYLSKLEIEETSEEKKTREGLIEAYWPGPLTIVLKLKNSLFAEHVLAPDGTVALRQTSHPILSQLADSLGGFLVATSANLSSEPTVSSKNEFISSFPNTHFIDDFNTTSLQEGVGSTIVKISGKEIEILRQGLLKVT